MFDRWSLVAENAIGLPNVPWTHAEARPGPGGVYYAGFDEAHGDELWFSRGWPSSARLVYDANPGPAGSNPWPMGTINGRMIFRTRIGESANTLWSTDGTLAGTRQLKHFRSIGEVTPHQGFLFFAADNGIHGKELWRTDGTTAGTVMIRDVIAGSGSDSILLQVANNTLFFHAGRTRQTTLGDVWVTDGTKKGTRRLIENTERFRFAVGFTHGRFVIGTHDQLWSTSGAPAWNVTRLPDAFKFGFATTTNGLLYFGGVAGYAFEHLTRTDGTAAGTVRLSNLDSRFHQWDDARVTMEEHVAFLRRLRPSDPTDDEVWISDGTEAGTRRIDGIRQLRESSVVGEHYHFLEDGAAWQIDLTSDQIALVPHAAGHSLTGNLDFFQRDGAVLLTSDRADPRQGRLLWQLAATGDISAVVFEDLNEDGRIQRIDRRLAGFRVFADLNGNGRFDATEPHVRTNSRGEYALSNIVPGKVRLSVTAVAGWTSSSGWRKNVRVTVGQTLRSHFGLTRSSPASGYMRVGDNAVRTGAVRGAPLEFEEEEDPFPKFL